MSVDEVMRRARERARTAYPDSSGLRSAYARGARAAVDGRPSSVCPYRSTKGWGPTFRIAWMRGHRSCWAPEGES